MTRSQFATGSGVPPGWSLGGALKDAAPRAQINRVTLKGRSEPILLGDTLIASGTWRARNQGTSSKCNAYAVAAALELRRWKQDGALHRVSEDALYTAMRASPLDPLGDKPDVKDQVQADGSTFLFQAREALMTRGVAAFSPSRGAPGPQLDFVHNIAGSEDPAGDASKSGGVAWQTADHDGAGSVVNFFVNSLAAGVPVVAAIPVFAGWESFLFNPSARFQGALHYDPRIPDQNSRAIGGHSVCILGYAPRGDDGLNGWFVFRNSHGTARFGSHGGRGPLGWAPYPPARGYGIIATQFIETYCWEYLAQRPS